MRVDSSRDRHQSRVQSNGRHRTEGVPIPIAFLLVHAAPNAQGPRHAAQHGTARRSATEAVGARRWPACEQGGMAGWRMGEDGVHRESKRAAGFGAVAAGKRGVRQEAVDRCGHKRYALARAGDAQPPAALAADGGAAGYSPSDGGGGE